MICPIYVEFSIIYEPMDNSEKQQKQPLEVFCKEVYIKASGNILASGNLCFRVFKL